MSTIGKNLCATVFNQSRLFCRCTKLYKFWWRWQRYLLNRHISLFLSFQKKEDVSCSLRVVLLKYTLLYAYLLLSYFFIIFITNLTSILISEYMCSTIMYDKMRELSCFVCISCAPVSISVPVTPLHIVIAPSSSFIITLKTLVSSTSK